MDTAAKRTAMRRFGGILIFLFAFASVMYYLWGPLFITELQGDTLDTLKWANACVNSGSLVDHDFFYPYVIPFGGQLLMIPFVSLFGEGILALRCGMTLFTVILSAAFVLFFDRCLFRRVSDSLFWSGILLMLLETNKKLREIMYSHVLHYSLAILFALLLLVALLWAERAQGKGRAAAFLFLISTCFFASANGTTVLALSVVPVGCAFVLERIFALKMNKRDWTTLLCAAASMLAGFAVYLLLTQNTHTSYADRMELPHPSLWKNNVITAFKRVLYVFEPELYSDTAPAVHRTLMWNRLLGKAAKLATLILPILAAILTFVRWKHLDRNRRMIVLTSWVLTLISAGLSVVTHFAAAHWRLIPMYTMILICLAALLKDPGALRIPAGVIAAAAIFMALNSGTGVFLSTADADLWTGEGSLIGTLRDLDLHEGCSDDYQMSFLADELGDDIRVLFVQVGDQKLHPLLYENDLDACAPREADRYFAIAAPGSESDYPSDWIERHTCSLFTPGYLSASDSYCEYTILVYDYDPVDDIVYEHLGKLRFDRKGEEQ